MRKALCSAVLLAAAAGVTGCESDANNPNRPAGSVVSPDSNAGFGGSGGVNGMYDQPAPATPDGTSGRYGGSGIISGGTSGRTEDILRPGSPDREPAAGGAAPTRGTEVAR